MEMTFLLILFLPYWIRQSGGSPCSITATATNGQNGRAYKLQLQLQCGTSMCNPFTCNHVGDELNITCTGLRNCRKMKTYSVCDSPENICVAPERLNSRSSCTCSDVTYTSIIQPSTTIALSDCTPVTSLSTANQTLPPALGTLLGIIVMALAVTITGWVWTYWTMRKRQGMKITSDEQERTLQNPIYTCTEATETQQSSNGDKHHMAGVPTYATVSKSSKKKCGNKNNQANIKITNSQIHNYHQEPEDAENSYSLLGREESGEYNITERSAMTNDDYEDPDEEGEGWGQAEENVYHVLEGPATTEGEGPITQDEATVYEVPVPSKPTKINS